MFAYLTTVVMCLIKLEKHLSFCVHGHCVNVSTDVKNKCKIKVPEADREVQILQWPNS